MDVFQVFFPQPNPIQLHALVFLLGSLSVSALSDIRRLAAQADFSEVWIGFAAAMFAVDAIWGAAGSLNAPALAAK